MEAGVLKSARKFNNGLSEVLYLFLGRNLWQWSAFVGFVSRIELYRHMNLIRWVRKLDGDLKDTYDKLETPHITFRAFNGPIRETYYQPQSHRCDLHFSPLVRTRYSSVSGLHRAILNHQAPLQFNISHANPIGGMGSTGGSIGLPFKVIASPLLSAIRISGW
jgi:hypothetical protein